VMNSAGSAQEEREISTWVDLVVLLTAAFLMVLVTSWKKTKYLRLEKLNRKGTMILYMVPRNTV
jgi:hypothetical protein